MKKINILSLVILLSSFAFYSCQHINQEPNLDLSPNSDSITPMNTSTPSINSDLPSPTEQAKIQIDTQYGSIEIDLFTQKAPNTVANFLAKSQANFYDGLIFHRVEPGFVVQGGDPLGNGTGGGNIASEINNTPFKRGSLGLARGGDINISNDSQFFICLTDEQCQHLTNQYVNFGQVISGMDFVDQIKAGDKILSIQVLTK